MTINKRIERFNRDRNMIKVYDRQVEFENLREELEEFIEAKDEQEEVDALCDIIVFASGALMKLGYDVDEAMDETLKEIESRVQDPAQKILWDKYGVEGKWQKWKRQPESDKYKAVYKRNKNEERFNEER